MNPPFGPGGGRQPYGQQPPYAVIIVAASVLSFRPAAAWFTVPR